MKLSREVILRIASRQRMVLYAVLAAIVALILFSTVVQPLQAQLEDPDSPLAPGEKMMVALVMVGAGLAILGIGLFQMISVFRLAMALDYGWAAIVFILAQLIPCVSLIMLVILNARATERLKVAGIRVGILGASQRDLDAYHPERSRPCPGCGEPLEGASAFCPLCGAKATPS